MSAATSRLNVIVRRMLGEEAYIFLAYALLTVRTGARPPRMRNSATIEPKPVPTNWTSDEYALFIEEARLDVAQQQADKHDIRARAQALLTTAILVAGVAVTSYASKKHLCACGQVLYALAGLSIVLAILAAGGLISARSDIGTVSVPAITHYDTGEIQQTVAMGYASTRLIGAETVAVMVTVLRSCVLALVIGAALVAFAHLAF